MSSLALDKPDRSRWLLTVKAKVMRFLMAIGMLFHKAWSPRPLPPSFTQWIPSKLADVPGNIRLSVYVPHGYKSHRMQSFKSVRNGAGYPVIINLHGGGFTLGSSTDDARFISTAVSQLGCVVVSVDYRLAPEFPFPVAVDDCADAVLWVAEHAQELGIDAHSIAIGGFSSGGNLTLTVPVRLHDHVRGVKRNLFSAYPSSPLPSEPSSVTSLIKNPLLIRQLDGAAAESSTSLAPTLTANTAADAVPLRTSTPFTTLGPAPTEVPRFTIKALCPFYAPTNYALSRAERRATNPSPDHDLPSGFTTLFDDSYMHPADLLRRNNAYLSPALMSGDDLCSVYGDMPIFSIGCEYDMLCREGAGFVARLRSARSGNTIREGEELDLQEPGAVLGEEQGVTWAVVLGAPHGWDKHPFLNKMARDGIQKEYDFVLDRLRRVFFDEEEVTAVDDA
ncbi:hypothetical protein ANO11243_021140 [Dothideomycetidae sp. 11243]|nr:hypothetical protein ANO11243_021140 [fungal sp. No.11243]